MLLRASKPVQNFWIDGINLTGEHGNSEPQDYSNEHRTLQECACQLNGRMSSISKVKRVKSRRVLAESGKKWGVPQR